MSTEDTRELIDEDRIAEREEAGVVEVAKAVTPKDAAALRTDLARVTRERDEARAELSRWTSGQRRKSWPKIETVPDGMHYAAELVRAQGTEGGEAHDDLLRDAAMRLKALHDVAGPLLAERQALLDVVNKARAWREWFAQSQARLVDALDTEMALFAAVDSLDAKEPTG